MSNLHTKFHDNWISSFRGVAMTRFSDGQTDVVTPRLDLLSPLATQVKTGGHNEDSSLLKNSMPRWGFLPPQKIEAEIKIPPFSKTRGRDVDASLLDCRPQFCSFSPAMVKALIPSEQDFNRLNKPNKHQIISPCTILHKQYEPVPFCTNNHSLYYSVQIVCPCTILYT